MLLAFLVLHLSLAMPLLQDGAGHIGHSSIEMLLRKPVNSKNDIWALGITLAELFTARLIWAQGDTEAEVSDFTKVQIDIRERVHLEDAWMHAMRA